MVESQRRGSYCEDVALRYYLERGFRFVSRNQQIAGVEIDLIFQKSYFIMVEVKSLRHPSEIGFRVSQKQLRRLLHARAFYQEWKNQLVECKILYVNLQDTCLEVDITDHF